VQVITTGVVFRPRGATSVVFQGSDAAPDPAPLLRALGGLR
jgi:hypothetical protein